MGFFANARRKRMIRYFYSDTDIFLDGMRVCPLHKIPNVMSEGSVLDFYIIAGNDCYMLRVINDPSNTYTIQKENPINTDFTLLVARKTIANNVRDEVRMIVEKLRKYEIPNKLEQDIVHHMEW